MAQPIYKVYMFKYTEAWYQLSKEEQDQHNAKIAEIMKQVGGETIKLCVSVWCSENWMAWGVEKFPSLEAVQQQSMLLFNINHFRYIESNTYLGIDMPQM